MADQIAGKSRVRWGAISLPALCITVPQVTRLLAVQRERAVALLEALEADGFLMRTHDGAFRRAQPPMA